MITWLNALDPFPDTTQAWGAATDAPGLLAGHEQPNDVG